MAPTNLTPSFPRPFFLPFGALALAVTATVTLSAAGCDKGAKSAAEAEAGAIQADSADAEQAEPKPTEDDSGKAGGELAQLLTWLSPDALAVSYDRLEQKLDPAVVSVVYALPPKTAVLLEQRALLDEGLDVVFDTEGDGAATSWLQGHSLGFTIALSTTPFFLRPLSQPAAEVEPFLDAAMTKNSFDGTDVWLPRGAFPWRIALLEGDLAAFIPVDIPGAGLEPLLRAREQPPSAVETQLIAALEQDPNIRLTLLSGGPLLHFDVDDPIAQVQFALRRIDGAKGYEGQIVLAPTGDLHACAKQLTEREHPEENQQVQALIAAVQFTPTEDMVVGRLVIEDTQLKHFLRR